MTWTYWTLLRSKSSGKLFVVPDDKTTPVPRPTKNFEVLAADLPLDIALKYKELGDVKDE